MSWKRVNKNEPCPICGKPDWCMVAGDQSAAICSRIASEKQIGRAGAGWLHVLRDDAFKRPAWRPVKRAEPKRPSKNMNALANEFCRELRQTSLVWLSNELCVSRDSLMQLRVGWSKQRRAFSFPMREPNGNVCGIRYRAYGGDKFSESGSREGLFFQPENVIRSYLVIVEGASDTTATMDLGFSSVIGRASCHGNIEQVATLCRRKKPNRVVIIPDNDECGWHGARMLQSGLVELCGLQSRLLGLPEGVKDVRQCIQQTESAERLRDQLGTLTESSSVKHGATSNDRNTRL